MQNRHPLEEIRDQQKEGISRGIWSVCSAHGYVIEAAMEQAMREKSHVLIEATCNQVNQFGGYTGMKPEDFRHFVFSIARKVGLPVDRIILGGDHLGPHPWKDKTAKEAMEVACEMVRQYVRAGFSKIHLDASMSLAGDKVNEHGALDPAIIAERCAILCAAAEEAFAELGKVESTAMPPVYVIGTEVPTPGGSQEAEDELQVTRVADLRQTVELTREAFYRHKLGKAWERVVAVVVQPGVEFGNHVIQEYDRDKAKELSEALREFPNLVFEGHSTDYQLPELLKQMVEDGVAILKVGPALTFAMREALFLLSYIENELFEDDNTVELSHLPNVLDEVMKLHPEHWQKHYQGNSRKVRLDRKYSLFDRSRYYWSMPEVKAAVDTLLTNLSSVEIPLSLISQFFPNQYWKIRQRLLSNTPYSLVKDKIIEVLNGYSYAVNPKGTGVNRETGSGFETAL